MNKCINCDSIDCNLLNICPPKGEHYICELCIVEITKARVSEKQTIIQVLYFHRLLLVTVVADNPDPSSGSCILDWLSVPVQVSGCQ